MGKLIRFNCVFLVLAVIFSLCGCGEKKAVTVSVYAGQYEEILLPAAENFTHETGTKIKFVSSGESADLFYFDGINAVSENADTFENLKETAALGAMKNASLALSSGGFVYGIPLKLTLYTAVCRKKFIPHPESITSLSDLEITAEELNEKRGALSLRAVFAPIPDRNDYLLALLSLPIYAELSENDDYDTPLFAAFNAKQLAFRYAEECDAALEILSSYSENSLISYDALDRFKSGEYAVAFVSTDDAEKLEKTDDIGILPISFDGTDAAVLTRADGYFGINAKSSSKTGAAAKDFLAFIAKNASEFDFLTPFSAQKAPENAPPFIKEAALTMSGGKINFIPVLSDSFPQKFKAESVTVLKKRFSGNLSPEEASGSLRELWKSERAG